MVSAELALALLPLVLVLALCLAGLGLAVDQVRSADAARVAARAASRGEPTAAVHELATSLAPEGSRVSVRVRAGQVEVLVEAPARSLLVGAPSATGRAVVPLEPGLGGGAGLGGGR